MNYTKKINETAEEEEWDGWDAKYVSSFETVAKIEGYQKGIQEGRQEGEASLPKRQLHTRFPNQVTKKYLQMIKEADSDKLSYWGENLMRAKNIEEVFCCI
ncbi:MAG: hypothetical protein ACOYK6_03365 [Chthoniobacterales bacterium]